MRFGKIFSELVIQYHLPNILITGLFQRLILKCKLSVYDITLSFEALKAGITLHY